MVVRMTKKPVLVIGGTGYVGGRLVPMLLSSGYTVRVAGRSPEKIRSRSWGDHENVQVAQLDIHDLDSITEAAQGCGVIFYLVHSVAISERDYGSLDRNGAFNMLEATRIVPGLERLIYLGSLGDDSKAQSRELTVRQDVARILSFSEIPVTTLKAGIVIGSGSASFEILSYMVDRNPIMLAPKWMKSRCQPISIRNVLVYLLECLEREETAGQTYDIAGTEIMTYAELFQLYARTVRLRRRVFVPVPFRIPRLSAYWISLISPVPYSVSRIMIESLLGEMVSHNDSIKDVCPQKLMSCEQAIIRARDLSSHGSMETSCFDSGVCVAPEWIQAADADYAKQGVFKCEYSIRVKGKAETLWNCIKRIGGDTGWYCGNTLWRMRGLMDKIMGGVGLSRGRRDPENLRVGDALDFWRVATVDPPHQLRLVAEMLVWGQAVLELTTEDAGNGKVDLFLTAYFRPKGLLGLTYWYSVYPFHSPIFRGMLKNIAKVCNAKVVSGPKKR